MRAGLTFCAFVFYSSSKPISVCPEVGPQDRLDASLSTCPTPGRIFDSVSDGIITVDQRTPIINHAVAALTGFTREETGGWHFTDVFTDGLTDGGEPLRKALERFEYITDLKREIVGKTLRSEPLPGRSLYRFARCVRGRFELVDGVTIFLDEIADISPPVPVKQASPRPPGERN